MCICLLLMTAVWAEVSSLEVKQARGTMAVKTNKPYDVTLQFKSATDVEFQLKQANKVVKKQLIHGATLTELRQALTTVIKGIPALQETEMPVASAMVTPAPGVNYEALVAVIDTLRNNRMQNLGVVPIGGNT